MSDEFAVRLGDQLRRVRRRKGLSLQDVEAASDKEFKASIVGAYERGERAVSASRLARLAAIYEVPPAALLPGGGDASPGPADGRFVLSLSRLRASDAAEARALLAFARRVQAARGDWGGETVAVRSSDVVTLAAALDRAPADLLRRIEELGLTRRRRER